MKILFRFLSVLLSVVLIMGVMVACGKEESDVPDNMQDATCAGAHYRLYVPTTWTPKVSAGVSGAYMSLARLTSISAYEKTVTEETSSQDVWEECFADYSNRWEDFEILNTSENMMGGVACQVYAFTFTHEGDLVRGMQITVVSQGRAYILLYAALDSLYEDYVDQIFDVVSEFKLGCDPAPGTSYEMAKPESVPNGMYCISGKTAAYYFFIPQSWNVLAQDEVVSAKAPKDESNVTLTVYVDSQITTAEKYITAALSEYDEMSYELLSQEECQMGGVDGQKIVFTVNVSGHDYKIMQVVVMKESLIFGPMAYVLTYTSTNELFGSHLSEVESMQSEFVFR